MATYLIVSALCSSIQAMEQAQIAQIKNPLSLKDLAVQAVEKNNTNIDALNCSDNVKEYLKRYSVQKLLRENDNNKQYALCDAAKQGRDYAISAFINMGADVNGQDEKGRTVLQGAVLRNKVETVKALVAKGASVDTDNNMGVTALMCAAFKGYRRITEFLLGHGATVDLRDIYGVTPLNVRSFRRP